MSRTFAPARKVGSIVFPATCLPVSTGWPVGTLSLPTRWAMPRRMQAHLRAPTELSAGVGVAGRPRRPWVHRSFSERRLPEGSRVVPLGWPGLRPRLDTRPCGVRPGKRSTGPFALSGLTHARRFWTASSSDGAEGAIRAGPIAGPALKGISDTSHAFQRAPRPRSSRARWPHGIRPAMRPEDSQSGLVIRPGSSLPVRSTTPARPPFRRPERPRDRSGTATLERNFVG